MVSTAVTTTTGYEDIYEDVYDDYQENEQVVFISEKNLKILETAAEYAGIFRANPHLFVEHYFNIHLKDFQKILLWEMYNNDYGMYVASRGQGKVLPCINREKSVKPKIFYKSNNKIVKYTMK